MEVVFEGDDSPIKLISYIDRVVRGSEAKEKLAEMFGAAQINEGKLRVRRQGHLRHQGSETSIASVDGFLITVQRQVDVVDAPLTKGEYGDYAVALAAGQLGESSYKLLFRQREGEPAYIHGQFTTPRPRTREH
jgi:hypothetical protein